jgi:hypothetical protein
MVFAKVSGTAAIEKGTLSQGLKDGENMYIVLVGRVPRDRIVRSQGMSVLKYGERGTRNGFRKGFGNCGNRERSECEQIGTTIKRREL